MRQQTEYRRHAYEAGQFGQRFFQFWNGITDSRESVRWKWSSKQHALWRFVYPAFDTRFGCITDQNQENIFSKTKHLINESKI